MDKQNCKMSWMIDKMEKEKDKYKYRLYETKKHFGHVVIPTGVGKSGICIEDIIKQIELYKDGTLMINISCPILKLTQQLMKDLFEVIQLRGIDTDDIAFFINSSDDGGNYDVSILEIDVNPFSQFVLKHRKINIIASCNLSMWKFINFLDKVRNPNEKNNIKFRYPGYVKVYNYLDEAHLLPIIECTQTSDGDIIDLDKRINLHKLCELSDAVYAFTATPDPSIVNIIQDYESEHMRGKPYIINVSAKESIQKGDILPPLVKYISSTEMELTVKQLVMIMEDAKIKNPNIHHKVLVTTSAKADLQRLDIELQKAGYHTICICDPNGGYEQYERTNIAEFSREVESYEGDCFVIHIRMLREGIDIKGLTDCVIFSRSRGDAERYRMFIQTIGRVLRCRKGERGKKFVGSREKNYMDSPRLKKWGGVYFIQPAEDAHTLANTRGLIERYYGLGVAIFETLGLHTGNPSPGSNEIVDTHSTGVSKDKDLSEEHIEKLLMKISTTINDRYGRILGMKIPETKEVYKNIKKDIKSLVDVDNAEFDTVDWLMNREITDYVYKTVPKMLKSIAGFDVTKFYEVL